MSLTIHRSQQGGAEIIRAEGRVDSSNAGEFEAATMAAAPTLIAGTARSIAPMTDGSSIPSASATHTCATAG